MVYDATNHSYVITFAVPQLLKVKCNDNVIRAAKVEISGLQEVERIGRSPERGGSVYREGCKQPVSSRSIFEELANLTIFPCRLMKDREPYELKNILLVYNFSQVLFSFWMFMEGWGFYISGNYR